MKYINAAKHRKHFEVLAASRSAQAAMMVLRPGQVSGELTNEHPQSEQWLLVLSGSGQATVNQRRVALRCHSLLLIGKAERHQIRNTGRGRLVTLNFYVPPAYRADGELKSEG